MSPPQMFAGRRFAKNQSGGVAILFALALPALIGATGVAVDYAAVSQSRARLQSAVDSAALSLAREMTVAPIAPARIQEMASLGVNANLDAGNLATVTGALVENGFAVSIRASQNLKTPLGLMAKLGGVETIDAVALARVTASSVQTKLCVLSLATKQDGGVFLHNGAMITAPECVIHSNSAQRNAMIIQQGAKITANLLCARGGIANSAGQLQAQLISDCPSIVDPLLRKPEPDTNAGCLAENLVIGQRMKVGPGQGLGPKVTRTLNPGVYCGGITIEGNARVTLNPGVYIMRGGPLVARGDAELRGAGVTVMFTGRKAYFRFLENSLIQLSAPTTGLSAGMLLWESRNFVLGLNSWQKGGCGNNPVDDDDDVGSNSCGLPQPGTVPTKKTNEHHINSDRARELTGTIYLPNGLLLVDSRLPVADQSPFTVLVANKVDLFDGPNLVLNANYKGSPVPVPAGLGTIGATQVRLGGAAQP